VKGEPEKMSFEPCNKCSNECPVY